VAAPIRAIDTAVCGGVQPAGRDAAEAAGGVVAEVAVAEAEGVDVLDSVGAAVLDDPPEPHAATDAAVTAASAAPAQRERNVPILPRLVGHHRDGPTASGADASTCRR
jgi:hypothetical protein